MPALLQPADAQSSHDVVHAQLADAKIPKTCAKGSNDAWSLLIIVFFFRVRAGLP